MKKKEKLRKFLYEDEVSGLIEAAKGSRYPIRDQALIATTYIHAFRAGEVSQLKWKDIDFKRDIIQANRHKGGVSFPHPLYETEKELLLKLQEYPTPKFDSPYVFITERGTLFTRWAMRALINRISERAGIEVYTHWHMLRHAKGAFLRKSGKSMEDIRDWMGHKHLASTEIYTRMAENPFFKNINDGSIFA